MADTKQKETFEFKAEVKQLLDILVHSLYTSREIFLRELISNASDALDKLRFESEKGTDYADKDQPLEISIKTDKDNNKIIVSDTGIGMTRDELIENIGTIARSGSAEFVKQLAESKDKANNIIGKFGVGFYSVFMVAEKVTIKTRSFKKDAKPVIWISDGLGSYELSELDEDIKRGTTLEIELREDGKEFADKTRLEGVIKKHSNFISFPINLEDEKVNTISALWREPKSSVKQEQYDEFYKFLTYDTDSPMDTIHVSVDAPIQFNALLFIPKRNIDMFMFNREDYGLDLYVKRVLIQHQNKDLLPEYLSFVKGVVDSEDLPLNISRETLQENVVFRKISQSVTKQVLSHLAKKAKDAPEEYAEFWKEHGRIFKLGYGDYENQEKYLDLVRFNSSKEDAEKLTSFAEYVERMKEGQNDIYYLFGPSRAAVSVDPHLEIFKKKDIEVLYLFDPVDEFIMSSVRKYKDYELQSADQAETEKLDKFENKEKQEEAEKLSDDDELHFDSLLEKVKSILGDRVKEVKVSRRLSGSPAVLVNPDDQLTSSMQRMMRMSNQDIGFTKKIFEINKDHALVRNLIKVFKHDSDDPFIKDSIEELFEAALLLEGDLTDPHALVNKINKSLERASGWYTDVKKL